MLCAGISEGAEGGTLADVVPLPLPTRPPKRRVDPKKLRLGGGKVWQDSSLDDWDPSECGVEGVREGVCYGCMCTRSQSSFPLSDDFRIFVGDLGNDVNDDLLARTFSKYPSFLKARVIRDKWTKKAKGYGFVSFKDPHDFMQAMREMNGK